MSRALDPPPRGLRLTRLAWAAIPPDRIICRAIIAGEPISKGRPRFGTRVYTPTETKQAEDALGWEIRAQNPGLRSNTTHDLGVWLQFALGTRQRKDIDNLQKLVLDAGNGLIWADDAQIVELITDLTRADARPRTELVVYTIGEGATDR